MTTSGGVQLTSGQKCILDLLQRKLFNTIQAYARLSLERQQCQEGDESQNKLDNDLINLKEKIRRISARQKRFSLEIINGNGNNTIPKESFFQALGLVTKEALSKLNSKSNERRRRTTANPRFSHEAIQAKRALEPLQKRMDPRVRGENRREAARKNATNQSANNHSTISSSHHLTRGANNSNNSLIDNYNINAKSSGRGTPTTSNNGSKSNDSLIITNERKELLAKFGDLRKEINSKVIQIKNKKEVNRRIALENERIRKRGLDIISAMNMLGSSTNMDMESQPTNLWIDMKCDESLEELD